jgi:RND family efflux transporter MFP subunit
MPPDNDKKALLEQLRIDRGAQERRSIPRGWWIGAAVLALVLAAVLVGLWLLRGGPRLEVEAVTAEPPARGGGATAILQATGYVTARRQATVSTQITGTLTQVSIEEGDHVKQGQVLARLDDTAQQAGLAQARAQLQASEAQLMQFQAQLEQARRDLVRNQDLVVRQLVSQQALEIAGTQVETLSAQVQAQRKQVKLAQAGVEAAQVQLSYTVVHAPFSGVIIAKAAQAGEIVSPISAGGGFTRTGVGTIVDMDSLEVTVDVNEAYIGQVKPDMPCEAVLDAYPDWKVPAHVIAIVPAADRGKATVKVRVALDTKDARLVPDMGVRISFLAAKPGSVPAAAPPKGVLVPAAAIAQRDGKVAVFVVVDGRALQRTVTVAPQDVGTMKLLQGDAGGVKPGDPVVLSPPAELRDGMNVKSDPSG